VFVAAVVALSADEIPSSDGWRAKTASMTDETKRELLDRFASAKLPAIEQLTNAIENLYFFPLWTMPCGGKWSRGRVLLLGDAAHAIPPAGAAAGVVFEDAAVLGRVLAKESEVEKAFKRFEEVRKGRIEKAWKTSTDRMEGVKRSGPLRQWFMEFFASIWLWWVGGKWDDGFGYDAFTVEI
jgi:2-polyprenyl-6-methoxyphenol hydroxylase-like FAD-dependent oxidoreductase